MSDQTKVQLKMTQVKDCKHSVVYEADGSVKNPPFTSVYLMRSFAPKMPSSILVTVEVPTQS